MPDSSRPRRCWVFVLGDFGRSPRMQYHTESILNKGLDVTVIAFPGSSPLESITSHDRFSFAPVPRTPTWLEYLPGFLHLCLKALFQLLYLMAMMLMELAKPDFVLVQIPPAIPTLLVCACVRLLRRTRVFLDWHNFAFTLMQLNPRTPSLLTTLAKAMEIYGGRFADGHFCVSKAMQRKLKEWKIDACVVYDRPHERYKPATLPQTHHLMQKLREEVAIPMHQDDFCAQACSKHLDSTSTILTTSLPDGTLQWRESRPAMIVSSTSWTPDEDFSILLSALELYDQRKQNEAHPIRSQHPDLLVIITGKGLLRDTYIRKMHRMKLHSVAVRTLWLDVADYPILLGSADLGVSLHASSSGLDLPMKVVDMFGCSLPVCSVRYPAISELITPNIHGSLFSSPEELSDSLWHLLHSFPFPNETSTLPSPLIQMRHDLMQEQRLSWKDNWDRTVWRMLRD